MNSPSVGILRKHDAGLIWQTDYAIVCLPA